VLIVPSASRRLRRYAAVGAAGLPLTIAAVLPLPSQGADPARRKARIDSRIQVVQGKIGRKRGTERVLASDIAGYTRRIDRLGARISTLRARVVRVQAQLEREQAELARIQERLQQERARLARLRARLIVTRRVLADRLVEIYESDRPDLLTVVLNAKGFADLLERGDFVHRISEQDQRIVTLVAGAKADAAATAALLTRLERRQQQVTATIQARRNTIVSIRRELIDTRVGYARTRAGKQHALAHVRTERVQLEGALSHLRAEQARIEAVLRAAEQHAAAHAPVPAGPIVQGNGALIWPVNGPITSYFCERRPWEACHPGIDIGVPAGTPIRAAAAGRVVLLGPTGGYGNFTCIQHTGVMSTCYAHQSAFATSLGATVSQGQVIGYVGCTGLCFGPHLHFEVRINGQVVNPLNYL
jgi:murein DD-endopeptidase MepM/ murein hydrolase activator NlpD